MGLFVSKTDPNELIITCHCGCNNSFHIQIVANEDDSDEDAIIFYGTYMSGNWYREQDHPFLEKLKKIWKILRDKDYYYSEICFTRQEWKMYQKWIAEH